MNPPIKPAPLQDPHKISFLPLQGTNMLYRIRLKLNLWHWQWLLYKCSILQGLTLNIFETWTTYINSLIFNTNHDY